jgi:hypothetical protein
MEQGSSGEASSHSTSLEISCLLWNLKDHEHVHLINFQWSVPEIVDSLLELNLWLWMCHRFDVKSLEKWHLLPKWTLHLFVTS